MKILKPKKLETLDIFAALYIVLTLYLVNSNIDKRQLIVNIFLIIMYFRMRFIK